MAPRSTRLVSSLIFVTLSCGMDGDAARILGVFPFPAYSHQMVYRTITTELSRRGHELVVFTTAPVNDPTLANYTEIDLHSIRDFFSIRRDFVQDAKDGIWTFLRNAYFNTQTMCDMLLSHPTMQQIISPNSTEQFDLLLMPACYMTSLTGIAGRLNVPIVEISSLPMLATNHYIMGNPLAAAISPDVFLEQSDDMTLWERMLNLYYCVRQIYEFLYMNCPLHEKIYRKYFGNDGSSALERERNTSLLLVNNHPFFSYPHPNVPAVIMIGGCRIKHRKNSVALPKDVKKVLDGATQGFIYFSLGSNVKSSMLPNETLTVFLTAFAELPYKVLWKFESTQLANKSDNVVIQKWLPQHAVLAHPNILLFVYQGGLQSTEEAIANAVPMIGIPFFVDQHMNVHKLKRFGIARKLDILQINKEEFKRAILETISDPRYKENARKTRDLMEDLPIHPLDNAMWWIEHVIRHKGASHLFNKSRRMSWYEAELLDVALILFVTLLVVSYASFMIAKYLAKALIGTVRRSDKKTTKND